MSIKQRLAQLRTWWQRHQPSETVAAASDAERLVHTLIGALDIAKQAHLRLEHWQDCLDLLSEREKVEQAHGDSEPALARTRFNRFFPLIKLGRLGEAQQILEGCLRVFSNVGDLTAQSSVLSALAIVWEEHGDVSRAIELQRQALAVGEHLANPEDRAISHGNLSNYLHKVGQIEEGARLMLAAMVYDMVTGNQQRLDEIWLRNLAILMQETAQTDTPYPLPRLNELLKRSEFSALRRFLDEWGVDVEGLQGVIDELVKEI